MRSSALFVAGVLGLAIMADMAAAQRMQTVDARGRRVDALRGVTIWVRTVGAGSFLMRRVDDRTSRIPGTSDGLNLHGVDLGIDGSGRLVLIYASCRERTCRGPLVVDVRSGGQRQLNVPVRRGCEPGVTASVWRDRIA
jgi:hypothetical protein